MCMASAISLPWLVGEGIDVGVGGLIFEAANAREQQREAAQDGAFAQLQHAWNAGAVWGWEARVEKTTRGPRARVQLRSEERSMNVLQ